jgi:hypothetical protein
MVRREPRAPVICFDAVSGGRPIDHGLRRNTCHEREHKIGAEPTSSAAHSKRLACRELIMEFGRTDTQNARGSIGYDSQWFGARCSGNYDEWSAIGGGCSVKESDTDRFYALLGELCHQLGGTRRLRTSTAGSDWPLNGVYFFFEAGERRPTGQGARVVRVGSHGLFPARRGDESMHMPVPSRAAIVLPRTPASPAGRAPPARIWKSRREDLCRRPRVAEIPGLGAFLEVRVPAGAPGPAHPAPPGIPNCLLCATSLPICRSVRRWDGGSAS